jgi:hypothetical protein
MEPGPWRAKPPLEEIKDNRGESFMTEAKPVVVYSSPG